jgi:N-acetyl sugar amidotransferase
MKKCSECLYPENHALNIVLDENGVCSGCKIHREKYQIDWTKKRDELIKIFKKYKSKKNYYDCVIPVSGGGDSFFIVDFVKRVLKANPLLVNYNTHYNSPVGIYNLSLLRSSFDADFLQLTVSPTKVKKITRESLIKMGSIYWHCIAGQSVFPVQIAVNYKIPLIIWGAHQGIDQVGMFSHYDQVEMTEKYRKDHDLMGFNAEDLVGEICSKEDLVDYKYPSQKDINDIGVRGIYLNNYIFWDSYSQHQKMDKIYNYNSNIQNRTFDKYNYSHCMYYSDVHDYIKFMKYGYAKINDNVAREIRLGKINKETGSKLINFYLSKKPKFLDSFLSWIGMTKKSFDFVIDIHRKKSAWERNNKWEWNYKSNFLSNKKKKFCNEKIFSKYNKKIRKKFNKDPLVFEKGFEIHD